ncbi:MAG: hypothetical protein ACR2IJ_08585 [Fluviibacter sp.]
MIDQLSPHARELLAPLGLADQKHHQGVPVFALNLEIRVVAVFRLRQRGVDLFIRRAKRRQCLRQLVFSAGG